ncbi:hypothetical protein [Acinetobacter towneri]|uniref:hypothetical protein n=1 Tax=Acinetobacter towneri TaxID=202956 RepID=UPI00209AF782|nr:hypothetical protein [Acinetobacter towneri]MCO8056072.1 hypothetical protein [Acinetobacter towneri]
MLFKTLDSPRDGDIHTLADFAELLCLTDIDGQSGTEAVRDQIYDNKNISLSEDKLQDLMAQIKWRKEAFGRFYPFNNLSRNNFDLVEFLTPQNKLYLSLLLCANLPFIDQTHHKILTDTFEVIAYNAFLEIWGPAGSVTTFGKNTSTYTGKKTERLNKLFADIGNKSHFNSDSFRSTDSGDGGIDLAAWIKLDKYQSSHFFSALAQCACSRADWSKKQSEIKFDRFSSSAQITNKWAEILFTPICFRGNNGEWAVYSEVSCGVLFDRLRIINALEHNKVSVPVLFESLFNEKRDLTC